MIHRSLPDLLGNFQLEHAYCNKSKKRFPR
jgi:hypothetical protein